MEKGLTNITSATTTTLVDFDSLNGAVNSIHVTNNSASNAVTIGLYLHDGTSANDSYFIKNLVVPTGVAFLLTEGLGFNTDVLSLKIITAGTSPDVSVIIR